MTNPNACFDTGQSLSTLKNVIVLEWEKLVREVVTASRHESSIILQDHIPALLDQLSNILQTGNVDEIEIGKSHGYYRSTLTDFSVADLLTEYSLLREILITYLYPIGEVACSKLIHKFIDILTKHAVVEFINDSVLGAEAKKVKDNLIIPTIN